ncbi:SCO2322 family protein [Streptomyces sp. NPDC002896]|uniref:SCO2322 family protein n=1 Tax=Streptomyces sp. NPDC002896 TaxID=3154438 RepID=UPI003322AE0C
MTRRRLAAPALGLLTVLSVLLGAGQAQAVGYRYWSFWERDGGAWAYATQGPSFVRPEDGAVQGFRFAVSEDSQDSSKPRVDAGFAAICADTPAKDGTKRVALVLDFGTAEDAPDGETPPKPRTACARVAEDATTADALAAVARPLRYDSNALMCAIAGYPETGCGEQVSSGSGERPASSPAADSTSTSASDGGEGDGGPSVGLVGGLAAVVLLGAAAVWQARRRRG